jgi:hypothetical protein
LKLFLEHRYIDFRGACSDRRPIIPQPVISFNRICVYIRKRDKEIERETNGKGKTEAKKEERWNKKITKKGRDDQREMNRNEIRMRDEKDKRGRRQEDTKD